MDAMVVIVMGVSGSGKTTVGRQLAIELGWKFADADDFHPTENREKMSRGIPLTDADRLPWLERLGQIISDHVHRQSPLVLACSALRSAYRNVLGVNQSTVRSVYLKASRELLTERLSGRKHSFFNNTLLESQLATLEEPADGLILPADDSPEMLAEAIRKWLNEP